MLTNFMQIFLCHGFPYILRFGDINYRVVKRNSCKCFKLGVGKLVTEHVVEISICSKSDLRSIYRVAYKNVFII